MNTSLMPDPTFYPSPGLAMQAAPERIAYVTMLNVGKSGKRDAMGVINVDPRSSAYGQFVGQVDFPNDDNELHHFGWNACSACLCPQAPHPHMERRYLVVPGIASSRIHILDTKADPNQPKIVKIIEPEEFIRKTGYTSPHTIHCGPDGIYGSALGSASGDGPGGIFLMPEVVHAQLQILQGKLRSVAAELRRQCLFGGASQSEDRNAWHRWRSFLAAVELKPITPARSRDRSIPASPRLG